MATRTIDRNDLVGLTSLSFIRPQRITFTVTKTKPLTQLYAFFDGVYVGTFVTPMGGVLGGDIVTDAAGAFSGTFDIPSSTFNTGVRVFRLQDDPLLDVASIPGNTVGSAEAKFTAAGLKQTFQRTVTNITEILLRVENIVYDPMPPAQILNGEQMHDLGLGDPLAQTFFTYGVKGGCFVTKTDIWFQSKDPALPVTLELREVINGYPGPNKISKWASVVLNPASVSISNNSSLATTFTFTRPIYLAENRDYCFVLMANSNKYNVWTSKFGDVSVETGKTIFEQPYIGSLFKSENNVTWTAEQTEDIKFKIYKAAFDISVGRDITSKLYAPPILVYGSDFSVTSGSAVVTANFTFQHGHKTGDKIFLSGVPDATYRGITVAAISNVAGFTVTVSNPYSLTFNCGSNATSTGTLACAGIVNIVDIDAAGTGYVAPSIVFTGGGASSQATATAVVTGGKITGVTITNRGIGYTSTPTLTLTDAAGTGAILTPITDTLFGTALNRKFQSATPIFSVVNPPDTRVTNTLRTSDINYVVGQHEIHNLNTPKSVEKSAVLVSQKTELASFGSNPSTQMITRLESSNPNVSPVIDLSENPRVMFQNFIVNDSSNSTSELTPNAGTSYARYISRITTIETISKGVRIFVAASSVKETSFDVFIRTSLSSNSTAHSSGSWVKLSCDVSRNLSVEINEYKDYLFYLDDILPFDVYDLKIAMYSDVAYLYPKIADYRCVILAT